MGARRKRPLTDILKEAGKVEVFNNLGILQSQDAFLADMMWQWVTTGKVEFIGGRILEASSRDWKDAAQWIYQHADGPASKELLVDFGMEEELEGATIEELEAIIVAAAAGSDSGVTEEGDGDAGD